MNFLYLKRIRVAVSLFFFILTLILFLNINEWFTSKFSEVIIYLQFVPSIIKFLSIVGFSALGFILIIIITFIWGRIYCSSICPLGTLQDIVSYLSRKWSKKKNHFYLKSYSLIRYSFLSLTLIFIISGSVFLLNLLDPFSIFGKIVSNIFRPLLLNIYNFITGILESINLYWIYRVDILTTNWLSVSAVILFLAVVVLFSAKRGRLFCNTVCPVGTLLGLFAKFSVFQIKIDESNCVSCHLCERECKAGCIDKKNKVIDFTRCVSCFNCFNACHSNGIVYTNSLKKESSFLEIAANDQRRTFIKSLAVYFVGLTGISLAQLKIRPKKESTVPILKKFPVSPPGSLSIEQFTTSCTACHLCVTACPTQVLQPSFLEYGFLGMMQPRMDYHTNYCNYDCVICSQVCPTGAIKNILPEAKKLNQLGKAIFVKDNCIVYTEETTCGACSEHCPTKAVDITVPHKHLKAPEVNDKICIGCGACEYACPTKPYKAIYVEGNPIHLIAEKPKVKKLEEKINLEEDFPF